MGDPHVDYWLEALDCALDAVDASGALTARQRLDVAKSLVVSAENQSLAFYQPPASDRAASVAREKDTALAQQQADHERAIAGLKATLARRMGPKVRPENISVGHDGRVYFNDGRSTEIGS